MMRAGISVAVWVLCLAGARAQERERPAVEEGAAAASPDAELASIRESLLYARYEDVVASARALVQRADLTAAQRNQALEAKAIADLALDQPDAAEATLRALYARDPGHRLSDADASPTVQAAFARVRESRPDTVPIRLAHEPEGTLANRDSPVVTVGVATGGDAVQEMRLAYRYGGETRFDTTSMRRVDARTAQGRIPLLSEREEAYVVEYFVEALSPSRTVLARAGSRDEPFRLVVPEAAGSAAPILVAGGVAPGEAPRDGGEPGGGSVLSAWWLWTAVVLVLAGGVAAYVLLGPPSEGPAEGTFGTATLQLR
jgi:hypothetical protein